MFEYQAPPNLLANKTILITGAGSGLGRAAALNFAAHGATTILLGRTVEKLEKVYDEIEAGGDPQAAIFPLDLELASDNEYLTLATGIEKEFGTLDGLLHSAAIVGSIVPIQNYSLETWNKVMQVNLNAAFALTKHLLPLLQIPKQASIIFSSSVAGREASAYWGAYSVSKHAIEALMRILFLELEKTSKIRINTINPGPCLTDLRKKAFPAENPEKLAKPEGLMNIYLYLMGKDSIAENGKQFDAQ